MKLFFLLLLGISTLLAQDEPLVVQGEIHKKCINILQAAKHRRRDISIPKEDINQLHIAKTYAWVNKENPMAKISPDKLKFDDGAADNYEADETKMLGEGAFSKVYKGVRKNDSLPVVMKKFKAPKRFSVNREIMILSHLKNSSKHIVNMIDAVRDFKNQTALLVYDYIASESFMKIAFNLSLLDLKYYMFQMALAIEESHSRGIMHRDIKMTNTIVDQVKKLLVVIDWGLGEFYVPGRNYSCRVGTRHYKAPELLLGNVHYDYEVDVWSYGSILAALIFKKHPFFKGKENDEVMVSISKVLGTEDIDLYLKKYNLTMPTALVDMIKPHAKKSWNSFINKHNKHLVTPEGLDLISRILVYDQQVRLTAKEVIEHPFFDEIRTLYN